MIDNKALLVVMAVLCSGLGAIEGYSSAYPSETAVAVVALMPVRTSEQMAIDSDGVLVGEVDDIWSQENAASEDFPVTTYVRINVERYALNPKNFDSKNVTIEVVGGKVGDLNVVAPESPKFSKGERVVVFLSQLDTDRFSVYGWEQGKFSVTKEGFLDMDKESNVFGLPSVAVNDLELIFSKK